MLAGLHALGFEMRQVRRQLKDSAAPPVGTWRTAPGVWDKLPRFPSGRERLRVGKRRGGGSNVASCWVLLLKACSILYYLRWGALGSPLHSPSHSKRVQHSSHLPKK